MNDYQPLDLSSYCNAGPEVCAPPMPALGAQAFHGLLFQIATVPVGWGELPFLAVPDRPDRLPARYVGNWGSVGQRQTSVNQAWPVDYYLWDWESPRPEAVVERIEIVPAAAESEEKPLRFLIAAVTASTS